MSKFVFFIFISLNTIFCSFSQIRQQININSNWKYSKEATQGSEIEMDDKDWTKISLPHSFNVEDAHSDPRGYYMGAFWYRKRAFIPQAWAGKKVFVYFEGANQVAEVYVNGKFVGKHEGGYSAFGFDISSNINPGQSFLLAVKVDNKVNFDIPPISADFTFYGGIYRDVYLTCTDPVHFEYLDHGASGIKIKQTKIQNASADLDIVSQIVNEQSNTQKLEVIQDFFDAKGQLVASQNQKLTLKPNQKTTLSQKIPSIVNPHLWSVEDPYLYTVVSTIKEQGKKGKKLDEVKQKTGLRWYAFDANTGFSLNGKPLKLMGVNRHQDFKNLGNALPDEMHRKDIQDLKEMGANFLRISHYPQDPAILDACDALGILAWEEIPVVNEIRDTKEFTTSCVLQMQEMIKQHYNHPCVIIWGYMNEVMLKPIYSNKEPEKLDEYFKALVKIAKVIDSTAKAEDSNRPTAIAFHHSENYNKYGLGEVPSIVGWNLYHGWYHDKFPDFGKFMDKQHSQYPNRIHIIAEFGAGSDQRINSLNPEQYDFSIQYQQMYHETYLKQILDRPFIAGATMWNLVDFGSEGRKESMPFINNKGLLYHDRTKKDIYYLYKALLAKENFVYLASRDWTFRKGQALHVGDSTILQPFKVYTNTDEVEFFVDGKSQTKEKVKDGLATFSISLPAGRHLLGSKGTTKDKAYRDNLWVDVSIQPARLNQDNFKEIGVNCGSTAQFTDPNSKFVWEADQAYTPDLSWGHIGGKIFRTNPRRLGMQDRIELTPHQPLFQTARDSVEAYQFDVASGWYEVELGFSELQAKNAGKTTIVNDIGNVNKTMANPSLRQFSVLLQDQKIIENLDLSAEYQALTAVIFKTDTYVEKGKSLRIQFVPEKGNPIVNTIRIRKK